MKNVLSVSVLAAACAGCAKAPHAKPITSINVNLLGTIKWSQITNQSEADQTIREWVPGGSTGDDTIWMIVEQKFVLDSAVSA
jgi:hypothetical protein